VVRQRIDTTELVIYHVVIQEERMDNKLSTSKEIKELFASLPAKRVGELDRKYLGEVLEVGFHNSDKSGICGRFEKAFAEKFGV
jgi:hypothetical protein